VGRKRARKGSEGVLGKERMYISGRGSVGTKVCAGSKGIPVALWLNCFFWCCLVVPPIPLAGRGRD